jgi:hypothetical protein
MTGSSSGKMHGKEKDAPAATVHSSAVGVDDTVAAAEWASALAALPLAGVDRTMLPPMAIGRSK